MDDFIGRRNLIAPETLRELTRRSDWKGAIQTLSHFGAIAVTGTGLWITWGSWWAAPWFIVHGMLVNFLFAAQHECNHYTAFETRWANDLVNRITGFVLLYPAQPRALVPLRAPSPHPGLGARSGADAPRAVHAVGLSPLPLRSELLVVPAGAALAPRAGQGVGRLLQRGAAPPHHARSPLAHRGIRARRGPFSGARVLGGAHPVARADALDQGAAPGAEHHRAYRVTHEPDTVHNTRTISTWPLLRWMGWNMQYHTAHHTFPAVPFHRLPELHAELERCLGYSPPTVGYVEFQRRFIAALARGPEPVEGVNEVGPALRRAA